MNRNKFLIGTGAFALAIGSFFAGNATKKFFTSIPSLYYKHGANVCTLINATSLFTTGGAGTATIAFVTAGGASVNVYTTSSCNTGAKAVKLIP